MRKCIALSVFLVVLCLKLQAQSVPFIQADQLTKWNTGSSDTVFVLNFWATWCKPCVEELPSFERITQTYAEKPVQVVLISMDFKRDIEKRVVPFVQENKLYSRVVFMNEPTPNKWINTVNTDWSGAIPATWIVGRGKNLFFEKQMTYSELEQAVNEALK